MHRITSEQSSVIYNIDLIEQFVFRIMLISNTVPAVLLLTSEIIKQTWI